MRFFHLHGEIDEPLLTRFISFCNDNAERPWTIIVDSHGGSGCISTSITSIINEHHKKFPVRIHVHIAYSGAFLIAYNTQGQKYITKYSLGMIHHASNSIRMNVLNRPSFHEGDAMLKQNTATIRPAELDEAKKYLTESEFRKFKKDHDIYLGVKRLMQIFPEAILI
jgi:hypothetical protein